MIFNRVETYYEIWTAEYRLVDNMDFSTYKDALEWCARYAPSYIPIFIVKRQTTWEIAKDES